jgi:hypothetical protein
MVGADPNPRRSSTFLDAAAFPYAVLKRESPMRAVFYARYSSDRQRETSIED